MRRMIWATGVIALALAAGGIHPLAQGTDLDAFMRQVLAKRDDN